jgi:replicative DNA helicase
VTTTVRKTDIPSAADAAQDLDAEHGVLGCLLLEGATRLDVVRGLLTPEDFFGGGNGLIYAHVLELHDAGSPVSERTLRMALEDAGDLAAVGGNAKIAFLLEQASLEAHLPTYARRVLDKSLTRQAHDALAVALSASENGTAPAALLTTITESLSKIVERTEDSGGRKKPTPRRLGEVLHELARTFDEPEQDFLPCPWPDVNARLGGGTLRTEVIIVSGRQSSGKSAFVQQWCVHAALQGAKTLIVSAEMADTAVARRMIAQDARVSAGGLRRRHLEPDEVQRVVRSAGRLHELPIYIDDQTYTLGGLRQLVRGQGYRLVVVDYLQLVRSPADAIAGRRLEVSAVSAALKRLAMREKCTVIALSSLSRLEKDRGKVVRPDASKLKESGDLEYDADAVLILHWPDTEQSERELIFAKVREGETGGKPMTLDFDPNTVRFVVPTTTREEVPF